nr:cation transporter [Pseudalkalibacillus decolorationis]
MQKVTLQVIGMACGNCVNSVEKALKEIGASGEVSLKSSSVTVVYDENKLSLGSVKDAIEDLGYDIA